MQMNEINSRLRLSHILHSSIITSLNLIFQVLGNKVMLAKHLTNTSWKLISWLSHTLNLNKSISFQHQYAFWYQRHVPTIPLPKASNTRSAKTKKKTEGKKKRRRYMIELVWVGQICESHSLAVLYHFLSNLLN